MRRISTAKEGKICNILSFTKDGKENNEYKLLEHIQYVKTLKRMNKTSQNSTH